MVTPAFVLALCAAAVARAQTPAPTGTGTVVGVVVIGGTTVGLGYSVIAVPAASLELFSDSDGRFVFAAVPAGRAAIRAKHLGYLPLDTTVVVAAGDTTRVTLELEHVPAQLPAVRTTATVCDYPGAPTLRNDERLAALFEQMKENAERHRLLVRSYPFEYTVERMVKRWEPDSGARVTETDTLRRTSERGWRYRPGQMMSEQSNPPGRIGGRWITMIVPELADFADDVFLVNHCFEFAGAVIVDAASLLRIDFVPARSVRTPDVAGSLFLDPTSFQIRRTVMRLVNPTRQVNDLVESQEVQTIFGEVVPGVPITAQMSSLVIPSEAVRVIIPEPSLETQNVIRVRFLRGKP
jgi:hypothetical protein